MNWKKLGYLILSCLAILGALSGLGYLLYIKEYATAVGQIALIYAAYPRIVEWFTHIIND